jgi:preprotein translocase subunit SecA
MTGLFQRRPPADVATVKHHLAQFGSESDSRLREIANDLRKQSVPHSQRSPGAHYAPAIALIAESIHRTHRLTPYDCQFAAGLTLAAGELSEMATGEGKTLAALLPSFVFALEGRGAHVATVNPYLAARDAEFARPVFERLGFTVGLLEERVAPEKKRTAYAADVTYGVGTEFGFDYLRDQLAIHAHRGGRAPLFHEVLLGTAPPPPRLIQRGHAFAIVDEADSIFLDEARSPLILSTGQPRPCDHPEPYRLADTIARTLREGEHFQRDRGRPELTDAGRASAHVALTDEALPHLRRPWTQYVANALHARFGMRRDVHYLVAENKVVIVDEFTGRPCPDRTWRAGLHQAAECAAGAEITEENSSEATITRPAYFRLYGRVCGLTGTATEAASELRTSYGLGVRVIPLHRPCRRENLPDRIFVDRPAKLRAVAAEVAARRARGQPVLVGTRTIANSEELAGVLTGFPFRLLNAKQDADEAEIISQAGEAGTVTIATNMAGRGAHIPLAPESEHAGGLHVIGLERHESARIDRQLIGRAARQGQPGSSQFFLCLHDDLILRHAPQLLEKLPPLADAAGELPGKTAAHFLRLQRRVEAEDRTARAALAEYDRWLDELKHAL